MINHPALNQTDQNINAWELPHMTETCIWRVVFSLTPVLSANMEGFILGSTHFIHLYTVNVPNTKTWSNRKGTQTHCCCWWWWVQITLLYTDCFMWACIGLFTFVSSIYCILCPSLSVFWFTKLPTVNVISGTIKLMEKVNKWEMCLLAFLWRVSQQTE